MMRSVIAGLVASVFCLSIAHAATDEDAYKALETFAKIAPKASDNSSCQISGSVDFNGFAGHLETIRDAWLNRDYSVDFYRQRRKQVFAFTVVKRFAEIITEGLYSKQTRGPCWFSVKITFSDEFGQPKELPAASWHFDPNQNAKVNWEKIDPREFPSIAIDYKVSDEVMSWISDEPSMAEKKPPEAADECQMGMMRANAIFIRATTWCKRNYMDTPAGYYALVMSRQCAQTVTDKKLTAVAESSMMELDAVVQRRGRAAGCLFVDQIEREVLRAVSN